MTQPSVARLVHYVSHGTPVQSDGTQVFPSACRAAVITGLDQTPEDNAPGEVYADLAVLNPTGMFFQQTVRLDPGQAPDGQEVPPLCTGRKHRGGTWHWPTHVPTPSETADQPPVEPTVQEEGA